MYHVGRPGADGYMTRVLQSWGIDGHNSHTNVCSSSARVGYALWTGSDRPSPDHANAKFILMLSSHLETGHYFNPHAQRIIEAKEKGAKICAIDIRLSNTASMADYWLSPHPGTEAFLLLAMAHVLINEGLFDRAFMEQWWNWRDFLREKHPGEEVSFDLFIRKLKEEYKSATPRAAAEECGVPEEMIVEVARAIGASGGAFATHIWRNAAAGNLGGWQVSRALEFLCALVGSVNARGGTNMNSSDKFVPAPFLQAPGAEHLERTALSARVPAGVSRDVDPPAALPHGRPGKDRRVLHARVQPGVDVSGRHDVGAHPARRIEDRIARGADTGLERNGPSTPTMSCRWVSARSATT